MGRRGPPKKPTALKRLEGNPGKQKKNRNEPKPAAPPPGGLEPPEWLDPVAQGEWRRLEPELSRLGLLTILDLSKFAAYCQWFAKWRAYEEALAKMRGTGKKAKGVIGELMVAPSGYAQAHALVALAKQAAEMMEKFGARFGLSPSDRSGLGLPLDPTAPTHDTPETPAPPQPRDDLEEFMNRRPRLVKPAR